MTDKVTFASGATSSKGHDAPYWLLTWLSVEKTALRFGAGNEKHENSDTVLANANWLKAFHARDLAFFRNRATHAFDHFKAEMQGQHDSDAGGNWGAVGWFLEVISFVEKHDPDFYLAIVGLKPHPGKREQECGCPRCVGGVTGKAEPFVCDSTPSHGIIPCVTRPSATVTNIRVNTSRIQCAQHGYYPSCAHCNACKWCCKCL